jgi:hypothetical protein
MHPQPIPEISQETVRVVRAIIADHLREALPGLRYGTSILVGEENYNSAS